MFLVESEEKCLEKWYQLKMQLLMDVRCTITVEVVSCLCSFIFKTKNGIFGCFPKCKCFVYFYWCWSSGSDDIHMLPSQWWVYTINMPVGYSSSKGPQDIGVSVNEDGSFAVKIKNKPYLCLSPPPFFFY